MSSAAITKYKLMILMLLDSSEAPLTNTQLSDFFLKKDYTDYFTLQKTINALSESGLIGIEQAYHNTHYSITPAGREAFSFFENDLSKGIKDDIAGYLGENAIKIRQTADVYAGYDKTREQEYAVRCRLKEKGSMKLDFTITVPKKEIADAICSNWKEKSEEVYDILRDSLIK